MIRVLPRDAFDIQQNDTDGATFVANISFIRNGEDVHVFRPLNSRDQWPVFIHDSADDPSRIFDEQGRVLPEHKGAA